MKKKQFYVIKHTPKQRFFGIMAFVALFVCGIMVGVSLGYKTGAKKVDGTIQVTNNHEQNKSEKPKETCQIIEDLLIERLYPEDSSEVWEHEENIAVYEKLVMNGCSENQMKYHKLGQREREIVAALQMSGTVKGTCEQIESLLLQQMPPEQGNAGKRIVRAKLYANLSERGCPQNSEKYVALAQQELEIARALVDDEFSERDTIEVVETYKRLEMQAAAQEIFDTVKKLTNPAIDFVLQVEKIINEQ